MKTLLSLYLFFLAIGSPFAASAMAADTSLPSGSKVLIGVYKADLNPGGGISGFRDTSESTYVLRIQPNGDRHYVHTDGSVHHGNSSRHTTLIWKGKDIPAAKQFVRLPPEGDLQPGMKWSANVQGETSCGEMPFQYEAYSLAGPTVGILFNGEVRQIETIKIVYVASVRICGSPGNPNPAEQWQRQQVVLFAPSLNEIVESLTFSFNWRSRIPSIPEEDPKQTKRFLDSAHGWKIVGINTS